MVARRAVGSEYNPLEGEDFKAFIEDVMKKYHAPGLSIAVVHKDRTYSAAYGYANLETGEKVTPHTLFYGASTTKSFTAALLSKLVYPPKDSGSQHEKITWDTPISKLLPGDFVLQDEYASKHLTLKDALSHRTGLPSHDFIWVNGRPTLKETTRLLRHVPLHNEIRTHFEYTNVMYTVATHALETVTRRSTEDLLHDWLLKPLGMKETAYSIEKARKLAEDPENGVGVARGYLYDEATGNQVVVPWEHYPSADGSGGIASSALDYAKWIRAFLNPTSETENPNSTLDPRAVDDMTQAHIPSPAGSRIDITDQGSYGLGLRSGVQNGYSVVEHSGGDPGHMTLMKWIPELDWGFVIFNNSYDLAQIVVGNRILDDFFQTPEDKRFDVPKYIAGIKEKSTKALEGAMTELRGEIKKVLPPVLPLQDYEGNYRHPAYGTLKVCTKLPEGSGRSDASLPAASSSSRLYLLPAGESSSGFWAVLDHVNGEFWLARQILGISKWLTDSLMRLEFVVGLDGTPSGLKMEAESAIDSLALFEKVE